MALDDVTFYNVLGQEISRTSLVTEMIKYYNLKLEVGETRVTDFNEGSEIRNLLEAIAVDLYVLLDNVNEVTKTAFIETATGEWLDKHGANPMIRLPRGTGTEAIGIVTFSLVNSRPEEFVIPEGTVVACEENGLSYITDVEAVIPAAETSVSVGATCLVTGIEGNCSANTITMLNDEYVTTNELNVNNSEAFTGGTDYEEDEEYRARLLDYIRKDDFGSKPYYQELGAKVEGVHDVLLVDATGYTAKVLVNGDTKPTPDSVLLDVLTLFTETDNIVLGHNFTVDKPDYVTVDLTLDLTVRVSLDTDDIKASVNALFNGGAAQDGMTYGGLNIGDSITSTDILNMLYIYDALISATVTYNGSTNFTIEPDPDEVLKVGTVTINQTVGD